MKQRGESMIKDFFKHHLKSIIAIIGFLVAFSTAYTTLYAQVQTHATEIQGIKKYLDAKESTDKEFRFEARREQREIKTNLMETNKKLDRLIELKIEELQRRGANPR